MEVLIILIPIEKMIVFGSMKIYLANVIVIIRNDDRMVENKLRCSDCKIFELIKNKIAVHELKMPDTQVFTPQRKYLLPMRSECSAFA